MGFISSNFQVKLFLHYYKYLFYSDQGSSLFYTIQGMGSCIVYSDTVRIYT